MTAGPGRRGPDDWDARYAANPQLWSSEPNATVAEIVGPLPPGRAVDLGAGEGRHALWLARKGWTVTAVDFSAVGIDRGRAVAAAQGLTVDWVVADVREWQPSGPVDLVLVAYLHLAEEVLTGTSTWLAPGGHLVVVGHALRNLTDGVGGPQDPAVLHTEEELRTAAGDLRIVRLGEVLRPTADGPAIDMCLVAHRD